MLAWDLLARLLYPPAGLPVGLVTALFGVPFFVYLLRKNN
ncbi:iron chelate uptake ABC transporter family permease subunit [Hymenobacter agri]